MLASDLLPFFHAPSFAKVLCVDSVLRGPEAGGVRKYKSKNKNCCSSPTLSMERSKLRLRSTIPHTSTDGRIKAIRVVMATSCGDNENDDDDGVRIKYN